MKFQKLIIHNIASIEDAVIDFEAQPLVDSEVFLITGKTGAGKSTILDAICLALYADTPRLYSTKMQGVTMDAEKEVKIDDPRQLMRRNTAQAHASLTFIGSNDASHCELNIVHVGSLGQILDNKLAFFVLFEFRCENFHRNATERLESCL